MWETADREDSRMHTTRNPDLMKVLSEGLQGQEEEEGSQSRGQGKSVDRLVIKAGACLLLSPGGLLGSSASMLCPAWHSQVDSMNHSNCCRAETEMEMCC
jgi:hypothetical protein